MGSTMIFAPHGGEKPPVVESDGKKNHRIHRVSIFSSLIDQAVGKMGPEEYDKFLFDMAKEVTSRIECRKRQD